MLTTHYGQSDAPLRHTVDNNATEHSNADDSYVVECTFRKSDVNNKLYFFRDHESSFVSHSNLGKSHSVSVLTIK